MISKPREVQLAFGGYLVADPYPYYTSDSNEWLSLLSAVCKKSIGLYGELMKIRAIGATLEKSDKFGYIIKPMYIGPNKRGFPSEAKWNEEKKQLLPYTEILKELLKEL